LLAPAITVGADANEQAQKRPFSHQDFDAWRSIDSEVLSRDGRYLAYSFMPLEGDGDFIVRDLTSGTDRRESVGALPPPLTPLESNPERPSPRRKVSVVFTSDSKFVVATAFPTHADSLQAKREKKKADELPKEGLVVLNLATGGTVRLDAVKNFQVPAKGGAWLAYLKTAAPAPKLADATTPAKPSASGSDLVLRNLAAGTERVFANVAEYSFARDGDTLVFTVSSPDKNENGLYTVSPGNPAAPVALVSGPGNYRKFTWDRTETQAAFVTDRAEADTKAPRFALWYWKRGDATAAEVIGYTTRGLPEGHAVSGEAMPSFSFDGKKLYASTAPAPKPADERLADILDEDKVTVDLWHWKDDFIQTVQEQRAPQERKRAYVGILDLDTRRFTQLADPTLASLTFNDAGTVAFGLDDRPYRRRFDYDGVYHDLYLVDAATGARELLFRELTAKSGVRWSNHGRWIAYYDNLQWFAIDPRSRETRPLTASLPIAFHDERDDHPEPPGSYGTAGWTRDGESFLLYDRYDVWQVFPDGRPARNLTAGFGRANKIQLRIQSIEPTDPDADNRGIDPTQPLYLRGEHEDTFASGYFRTPFGSDIPPERLLWADKNIRYIGRALDADTLLLSASRFDEYPDLLTTDTDFSAPAKVTDGGAQMEPFIWGTAETLTYRNLDGVELAATLYKPENFDPSKKYPMIVYFYERLSHIVHHFTPPVPTSYLNHTFYTSNGYLVLMPDIIYTVGHPGRSAFNCILPAVEEVVRRGFVDENAIGLSGHSWGGYQTAYLITQTNRFRAAEAGALVSNMTSAYAGIGWGSGRSRQFKYEKAQSRIGATIQESPHLYIENSPVFFADRVQTPLLILHNEGDDTVPWYQAIEYFLALRRHDKEVYWFNYHNEFHGLRRRADQRDFTKRMHQFFDHFLKDAPAPDWMTDGIPFLERDEAQLRFRTGP
jgi:dipeptidyl aminopeptidase/acylaminoacyl peptidase